MFFPHLHNNIGVNIVHYARRKRKKIWKSEDERRREKENEREDERESGWGCLVSLTQSVNHVPRISECLWEEGKREREEKKEGKKKEKKKGERRK